MASKKAVLVYILEILKDETDANHTLSQEEIRSILAERVRGIRRSENLRPSFK